MYSIYNGATYYIDIFGLRFQKELEQLKKDVQKWQEQKTPDLAGQASPLITPLPGPNGDDKILGAPALSVESPEIEKAKEQIERLESAQVPKPELDGIPVPEIHSDGAKGATGVLTTGQIDRNGNDNVVRERKGVHYED